MRKIFSRKIFSSKQTEPKIKIEGEKEDALQKHFLSLYVDGSSSFSGSGAGLVLISPDGRMLQYFLRFQFKATNNKAEYEAIIKGLTLAKHLEVQKIRVFSDSQLVINQINGEYEARGKEMIKYLSKVCSLMSKFQYCYFLRIPRIDNSRADILSKLATIKEISRMGNVFREDIQNPNIMENEDMMDIDVEASWIDPIINWLKDGLLPSNKVEARRVTYRSNRFYLKDEVLNKKSYALPLLRCLQPTEAEYALKEVHAGVCGNHIGGRYVAIILEEGLCFIKF
ncbi:RVT_3 domain-containing protein [Cephalotus follicularis]|uniref:RVT_3 domain-containing protein n=1 Tax=Cephalotus follicularis TaxID=3775 RepID=A0A1Q3D6L8_CEPFO|nr:RVT_3 domain-containing protein [Cephalotus follicularis]